MRYSLNAHRIVKKIKLMVTVEKNLCECLINYGDFFTLYHKECANYLHPYVIPCPKINSPHTI